MESIIKTFIENPNTVKEIIKSGKDTYATIKLMMVHGYPFTDEQLKSITDKFVADPVKFAEFYNKYTSRITVTTYNAEIYALLNDVAREYYPKSPLTPEEIYKKVFETKKLYAVQTENANELCNYILTAKDLDVDTCANIFNEIKEVITLTPEEIYATKNWAVIVTAQYVCSKLLTKEYVTDMLETVTKIAGFDLLKVRTFLVTHVETITESVKSAETVETPVVTPVETVETVETPVETVETPVETVETPVETVETPVETVETPVETVETPVETVETPVETVETPVVFKTNTIADELTQMQNALTECQSRLAKMFAAIE